MKFFIHKYFILIIVKVLRIESINFTLKWKIIIIIKKLKKHVKPKWIIG